MSSIAIKSPSVTLEVWLLVNSADYPALHDVVNSLRTEVYSAHENHTVFCGADFT